MIVNTVPPFDNILKRLIDLNQLEPLVFKNEKADKHKKNQFT